MLPATEGPHRDGLCPELDLFSIPHTQTDVVSSQWEEAKPQSGDLSGPIEINIDGKGEHYIDLYHTYVHVRGKITNADGSNLAEDAQVGPVNLLLHSLFTQVDLSLNTELVTPSTNTYAYRSYLETLLSYGEDAKSSQLGMALWHKDTAEHMDATDDTNEGLDKRKEYTARSNTVDLVGKLHMDINFQERYLLNDVDLTFNFVRNKDSFVLMAGGVNPQYKFVMNSIALYVRKVKLSDRRMNINNKALEKINAVYPIRRVVTKTFAVPAGNLQISKENLFSGPAPQKSHRGMCGWSCSERTLQEEPVFVSAVWNELCSLVCGWQADTQKTPDPQLYHQLLQPMLPDTVRCLGKIWPRRRQRYQPG